MKISVGFAAPCTARKVITEIGITVSPEVFKTRNMICASEARSFSGLSSCNSFIAFNPSGVAALSKPNMFAEKFIMIEPQAGWFLGNAGNRQQKNGDITRVSTPTAPPRSPIFIIPSHSAISPM